MELLRKTRHIFFSFLQKTLNTDIPYLLRGGWWLTLQQVAVSAAVLLLAVVFAHALPKEIYGSYRYILSIAAIIGALSINTGMSVAVTRAVARGDEGALMKGFRVTLKLGVIMTIAATIGAGYYLLAGNTTLAIGILIAGLFLPFMQSGSLYTAFLTGRKLFKESAQYNIVQGIIPVIALIAAVLLTNNVFVIVGTYFLANAIVATALFVFTVKRHRPSPQQKEGVLGYAAHLSIMDVFGTIAAQLDKVFLFHYLGPVALAVYTFSIALPEQIKAPIKNISSLALPRFVSHDPSLVRQHMASKMLRMEGMLALGIAVYIVAAPFLYTLLFPQYVESIFYSQIYALSLLASSLSLPVTALRAEKRTRDLYRYNLSIATVKIFSFWILIYTYGIMGAVVAQILNRFFAWGMASWLFFRKPATATP